METHAGAGIYDLNSEAAKKSGEYKNGIEKIISEKNPPDLVNEYLNIIKKLNTDHESRFYPGSPAIANYLLRPQDRMILSELHPEEYQSLKKLFRNKKQVAVHHHDGYQNLNAFLPPEERRGLVLIDPPYEIENELFMLPALLAKTLKKWETGTYAIWYPIKNRAPIDVFYRELKNHIQRPFLIKELCIYPDDVATRLNGSGMMIINPPWQFEAEVDTLIPWLKKHFIRTV